MMAKYTIEKGTGYKIGEIIKGAALAKYSVVIDIEEHKFGDTHTLMSLNISRYWPIKQIQLWALRKSFKNL